MKMKMYMSMNSGAVALTTAPARVSGARVLLLEAHSEFLRLLRAPSFCVPTIAFPLMFYLLFGIFLAPVRAHPEAARAALAAFLVIGSMAPGLFALGITLASDRERGLLELKRALPMPPGIYLLAKLAMAMLFAAIVALLLMGLAATLGGISLPAPRWLLLFTMAVIGVVPFCAIGLLVGALAKATAAPAVLNLIYLPMSFLSGLWVPLNFLPHGVARLAPLWPSWHLAQLGAEVIGEPSSGAPAAHALVLLAVAAVCFTAAQRALRRRR
jgi:ABC-2 type transport system permease protein